MHYKLSGMELSGISLPLQTSSQFSALADLYISRLCMGIIKRLKYTIAEVTRFHFHSPSFASGNRLALEELESDCTLIP